MPAIDARPAASCVGEAGALAHQILGEDPAVDLAPCPNGSTCQSPRCEGVAPAPNHSPPTNGG